MLDHLERKLRQMYAALGDVRDSDIASVMTSIIETPQLVSISIDFNANSDPIELHNRATLLVGNIACLKDHLKAWCKRRSLSFEGEKLIDGDKAVAIVHDLWNMDKHFELDRPPRSGHRPRLQNIRTVMQLSAAGQAGSNVFVVLDPKNGKLVTRSKGGGTSSLVLSAEVVDETGKSLGDFIDICIRAVTAWEVEFRAAGVPVPVP